jgi:hypothetical protein
LRGRGADWQFERRQGELVVCHSPHGRFGRRQPGPPFTGSPRDRAIGSRCSKPRPGPGIRRMRTVTPRSIRNYSNFFPNDPWYHLLAPEALSRCS